MSDKIKQLEDKIDELQGQLTSFKTAMSLVLSAEGRGLINNDDLKKTIRDAMRSIKREDAQYQFSEMAQLQQQQRTDAIRMQREYDLRMRSVQGALGNNLAAPSKIK